MALKFTPTQIWLMCDIINEGPLETEVKVKLQDDTTTNIRIHPNLLSSDKTGKHYIRCESFGRKNKLVYVKLPRPSLQHGHNITVKEEETKVKI